jgi:hypothetical protein
MRLLLLGIGSEWWFVDEVPCQDRPLKLEKLRYTIREPSSKTKDTRCVDVLTAGLCNHQNEQCRDRGCILHQTCVQETCSYCKAMQIIGAK